MIKSLYGRLLIACTVLLSVLLTGLGIVLGQFFPLFAENVEVVIQQKYLGFLILILICAFILSFLMVARMMRQYARPIDDVTETALRISQGDYHARTSITEPVSTLSDAINKIASNMQEVSFMRIMEKERLKTLVESMGSGLLMFGREGLSIL